ncbi:Phage terminase, large subunit (plasmid) [Pediococcus damnosus]|uniref:Phage terminase, large subunit n=1 Tax=Pediococcus damnosus TaxID=51663 RepID=A0ABM6A7G5_9LACO|nr:Phage terminase, large subunit [Pediococcus damnosus]
MRIDLTQTHDVIGTYQSLGCSEIRQQYTDPGTKYALDVLDQKVTAGHLIKLAVDNGASNPSNQYPKNESTWHHQAHRSVDVTMIDPREKALPACRLAIENGACSSQRGNVSCSWDS